MPAVPYTLVFFLIDPSFTYLGKLARSNEQTKAKAEFEIANIYMCVWGGGGKNSDTYKSLRLNRQGNTTQYSTVQ